MPRIVLKNPKSPIDLGIPIIKFLRPDNGDDKPIKFHELYIETKKPNPQKMVYLSVRIDGHTKTKINANIKFDNKQGEING